MVLEPLITRCRERVILNVAFWQKRLFSKILSNSEIASEIASRAPKPLQFGTMNHPEAPDLRRQFVEIGNASMISFVALKAAHARAGKQPRKNGFFLQCGSPYRNGAGSGARQLMTRQTSRTSNFDLPFCANRARHPPGNRTHMPSRATYPEHNYSRATTEITFAVTRRLKDGWVGGNPFLQGGSPYRKGAGSGARDAISDGISDFDKILRNKRFCGNATCKEGAGEHEGEKASIRRR